MRRVAPLLVVLAAALAVPAFAADERVTAVNNDWVPATLTVSTGDTVTWTAPGGSHDLVFSDGAPGRAQPGNGWSVPRRFDSAGTVQFRCTLHSRGFTDGMSGEVTVTSPAASPSPSGSSSPSASSTPSPSPGASVTPEPTPTGSPPPDPPAGFTVARVRVKRLRVTLTLAYSRRASVDLPLERAPLKGPLKYRRIGSLGFAGLSPTPKVFRPTRVRSGRKLVPGRYRLRITPRAASGTPATLLFRLR